jgi:hypothetical protein
MLNANLKRACDRCHRSGVKVSLPSLGMEARWRIKGMMAITGATIA